MSKIDWNHTPAAIWRSQRKRLKAIRHIDPVTPDQLIGIDRQKSQLLANTERFLVDKPANHALLWGARGTGKSSLIKAMLNHFHLRRLRMVEIDRGDLADLPEIVDELRELDFRFILFCDDLSFSNDSNHYRALKRMLQGSLELPPENILLYASSNRRHLLPEKASDNSDIRLSDTELHLGDAIEEQLSLSDRFGLNLSFYPIDQTTYLQMIDSLFPTHHNRAQLHDSALRFAHSKAIRSGRTARQFFNHYS